MKLNQPMNGVNLKAKNGFLVHRINCRDIPKQRGLNYNLINRSKRMDKSTEQYIEHEVILRVHHHKFIIIEAKLNFIIGLAITGVVLPVVLRLAHLI